MLENFFNFLFNEDFNRTGFFKEIDQDATTYEDYKKVVEERKASNNQLTTFTVIETWTDENGTKCTRTSVHNEPIIDKEVLKLQAEVNELREKIKSAVNKEDYETAAKLKKTLDKLKEKE